MTQHEKNQIDVVEKKLDKILFYLLDDPDTNSKGIVSTVKENQSRLDTMDTDIKVKKGKITILSMVGGGVISLIAWATSWIFK